MGSVFGHCIYPLTTDLEGEFPSSFSPALGWIKAKGPGRPSWPFRADSWVASFGRLGCPDLAVQLFKERLALLVELLVVADQLEFLH
jgi:hypothetical protein